MGDVPLTKVQQRSVAKWPCDGKARFTLKGYRSRLTYNEAYDAILRVTNSTQSFSRDGLRRIRALNQLYLKFAKDFVDVALFRMEQKIARQPVGATGQREEKSL